MMPFVAATSDGHARGLPPSDLRLRLALSSQFLRKRRSYLREPPLRVGWSAFNDSIVLRPGMTWYLMTSGVSVLPVSWMYLSMAESVGASMYSPLASCEARPNCSIRAPSLPKLS